MDALAIVEADGGAASHILANPLAWARLSKLKMTDTSAQSLLGNEAQAKPQRQLLGVPVTVDRDVPGNQLIVLDKRAVLSAYGQVLVATSTDYLFNRDSVALRITFRFGAVVAKPSRVVVVDVDSTP